MKQFKILLVGDKPELLGDIKRSLPENDFDVELLHPLELPTYTSKGFFDLVLLAAGEQPNSAFELCRWLKGAETTKDIPLIMVIPSGYGMLMADAFEYGADDCVAAHVNPTELRHRVKGQIEARYAKLLAQNINAILEEKVTQRTAELEDSLRKLSRAKLELESLSVAKSQLLNLISHEIRTPLNGIIGSMMLIGRFQIPEEVRKYFALLDISVKRLERFSSTILETSKLRLNGKNILICKPLNVLDILSSAQKTMTGRYPEKMVEMKIQTGVAGPFVDADLKYIQRCFDALIDNAYKFSPHGEVVNVSVEEMGGLVLIRIADNGPGFSKSALEYLFQPLSNHESHVDQNTGMGLYLAKVIVDAHSGTISVVNRETRGATVTVILPRKESTSFWA